MWPIVAPGQTHMKDPWTWPRPYLSAAHLQAAHVPAGVGRRATMVVGPWPASCGPSWWCCSSWPWLDLVSPSISSLRTTGRKCPHFGVTFSSASWDLPISLHSSLI